MNATTTTTEVAALSLTREALTTGCVRVTVAPDAAWLRVRELMGDSYHASYCYKIENVDGVLFLATWTEKTDKAGKASGRWVYTGVVNATTGELKLTKASAFPAHATRVRIADRVMRACFAGNGAKIAAAGWTVVAEKMA